VAHLPRQRIGFRYASPVLSRRERNVWLTCLANAYLSLGEKNVWLRIAHGMERVTFTRQLDSERVVAMSRIMLLGVTLLLLVAGCGSDSGGSDSTAQPDDSTAAAADTTAETDTTFGESTTGDVTPGLEIDPCSLLSADEISAATGIDFGAGTLNETLTIGQQAVCDWVSTGAEFATAQTFILAGGGDLFEPNMSTADEVFGLTTEPANVPGADRTYATAEGSIVGMDIAGTFVQVAYLSSGTDNVLDATLELATIAAGRIP